MKNIVNKFIDDINKNIICILSRENLLCKDSERKFKELKDFLRRDDKNIFLIIDFLANLYLYEDSLPKIDFIPEEMLIKFINDVKSNPNQNILANMTSSIKKLVIKHVMVKTRQLILDIFNNYHNVNINISKKNEQHLLILILVEYLYRHYLVKLPVINKKSVLRCLTDKKIIMAIQDNNMINLIVKFACSITKK